MGKYWHLGAESTPTTFQNAKIMYNGVSHNVKLEYTNGRYNAKRAV